ncbi:dynamin family protein [Streptococcus mutans]|uniref:dynamin family protein n=1 Tax=Streptococcus mutans TaxID=1309 RepID=UPI000464F70B|nr:dynamin family protein [Streptococcus mutans]MCB4941937.1 dynamin family protein [Streptococcus mutans]MCB5003222.1 dynamin family protein [Streptococcus mutans]MCB5014705.1 dynamin family protein [Streptococcus mutans]MCB5071236.1 dynamin family protein [Streptococcus mutans]
MVKVKISSNPYQKEILFDKWNNQAGVWKSISYQNNENSKLISDKMKRSFLPFTVKEIIDIIIEEYDDGSDIELQFEGTDDEFQELIYLVKEAPYSRIKVLKGGRSLENARKVLPRIATIFDKTLEIIPESLDDDSDIKKFKQSSDSSLIPVIIVGNYSSGKSSFINSLIGSDILPNSDRPITAKVFEIRKSPQPNVSQINFWVKDTAVQINIYNNAYTIVQGQECIVDVLPNIEQQFEQINVRNSDTILHMFLKVINQYEGTDNSFTISDLITIKVPFKQGILAESDKQYVIFDTPGSNSSSNKNHFKVLKKALQNMSNGLSLFVSDYTSLDTVDNENLYEELRSIKEIDDRFTLIIVNKADMAGLPKEGLDERQIQQILNQSIPRNLYSEGIFFVSSVIGLGSKNNGQFINDNYDRIFKKSLNEFNNSQSEYYQELYQYNIVPKQLVSRMKENVRKESKQLIYVNSGLFSIEDEIEMFANKYSAYNKCQQAKLYLEKIIERTDAEISRLKADSSRELKSLQEELERNKQKIIEEVDLKKQTNDKSFEADYTEQMQSKSIDKERLFSLSHLKDLSDRLYVNARIAFSLDSYEERNNQTNEKLKTNLKTNFESFRKTINFAAIKPAYNQLQDDFRDKNRNNEKYVKQKNKAFEQVSQQLLDHAKTTYQKELIELKNKLFNLSVAFWELHSNKLKDNLSEVIGAAEALSFEKREDIKKLIFDYEYITLENDESKIFNRNNFKLGIQIGDLTLFGNSHKIDLKKLTNKYNQSLNEETEILVSQIKDYHLNNYKDWADNLLQVIKQNIVDFNPDLKKTNDLIVNKNLQIDDYELRLNQLKIYSQEIVNLLAWKKSN